MKRGLLTAPAAQRLGWIVWAGREVWYEERPGGGASAVYAGTPGDLFYLGGVTSIGKDGIIPLELVITEVDVKNA